MVDFDHKFLRKPILYVAFLVVWFVLWEFSSYTLLFIYICFCFSLFGEEEEEDPLDPETDTEDMIYNVQENTTHFVEVMMDPNFLSYYYGPEDEEEEIENNNDIVSEVDDYNKFDMYLESMQNYLDIKDDEPVVKLNNEINEILYMILFKNFINKSKHLNLQFLFFDLNVSNYYNLYESINLLRYYNNYNKKKKKNKIYKKIENTNHDLYFRSFYEKKTTSLNIDFSFKYDVYYGLHINNFYSFLMCHKYDYWDVYLSEKKIKDIMFTANLSSNFEEFKQNITFILSDYDDDVSSEMFDIRNNFSMFNKFYFYDLLGNNKNKQNCKFKIYSHNYNASFLNLSFIKLPWQT